MKAHQYFCLNIVNINVKMGKNSCLKEYMYSEMLALKHKEQCILELFQQSDVGGLYNRI